MIDGRKLDVLFNTIFEITSLSRTGRNPNLLVRRILDCSCEMLSCDVAVLLRLSEGHLLRHVRRPGEAETSHATVTTPEPGFLVWLEQKCQPYVGPAGEWRFPFDLNVLMQGAGSLVCAPLCAHKAPVGVLLALRDTGRQSFEVDDLGLLTVLANEGAIVLENIELCERLEQEAVTDGLTGIYNYRSLMRALHIEVQRAARHDNSFAFVMADVDYLKGYNERFGHVAGSQVLAEIASIMRGNCRATDIVGKYGGDEFGLILPYTDGRGARSLVNRMRQAIASHTFKHVATGEITCSFGVAVHPDDARDFRELIHVADSLLFRAKRAGKNMVVTAAEVPAAETSCPEGSVASTPRVSVTALKKD